MTLGIRLSVPHRAKTLVALLAVASLALPRAGYGQTTEGERALLDRTTHPSSFPTAQPPP